MIHLSPERWISEEEQDWRRWGRLHLAAGYPPAHRNHVSHTGEWVFLSVCVFRCVCLPAASAAGPSGCADAVTVWTPPGFQTGSSSSQGRKMVDASSLWLQRGSPDNQWHHTLSLGSLDKWLKSDRQLSQTKSKCILVCEGGVFKLKLSVLVPSEVCEYGWVWMFC